MNMTPEEEILAKISGLTLSITPNNVGDLYTLASELYTQLQSPDKRVRGEFYVAQIRALARQAEIGRKIFANPPTLSQTLSDDDFIRIITMISMLHSFCYGVERLDEVSHVTGPSSTPISFYINSVYHYIAALYLLDKEKRPMGGTIYKTLAPIGLAHLLDEVKVVLSKPMEGGISFGEIIRKIRNDFFVHGSFSPNDISSIVKATALQDPIQQVHITNLIWELFNASFILKLRLIALLTASGIDPNRVMKQYIEKTYI